MKRYLTDSDTVWVNRYQSGELNDALRNNWQQLTVAEARQYDAFNTCQNTMHVDVMFVESGPAFEGSTIYGSPVNYDSKGRWFVDA